jgi:hypothetical protein
VVVDMVADMDIDVATYMDIDVPANVDDNMYVDMYSDITIMTHLFMGQD